MKRSTPSCSPEAASIAGAKRVRVVPIGTVVSKLTTVPGRTDAAMSATAPSMCRKSGVPEASMATGTTTTTASLAPTASAAAQAQFKREVLVYDGSANRSYFSGGGLDGRFSAQFWVGLLAKYKFRYRAISDVEDIESAAPSVLVLPSTVVLNARERQAIVNFRARGGSVVATWLTGVRDEGGAWRGFGFMQSALGAKVEGYTGPTDQVRYLNIDGDTPLAHGLPAGCGSGRTGPRSGTPCSCRARTAPV